MVELMPLQGNLGRAPTKLQSGRNHYESFSTKMECVTAEQESLRLLEHGNSASREGLRQPRALARYSQGIASKESLRQSAVNQRE